MVVEASVPLHGRAVVWWTRSWWTLRLWLCKRQEGEGAAANEQVAWSKLDKSEMYLGQDLPLVAGRKSKAEG
jgi:hypothetical protein